MNLRPILIPFLYLFLLACNDPIQRMGGVATIPLQEFAEITRVELAHGDSLIVNPATDYTYILDREGGMLYYLNEAYILPQGEWCLGDRTPDSDCNNKQGTRDRDGVCVCDDGGVLFNAGIIEIGGKGGDIAIDEKGENLYVTIPEDLEIGVIDSAPWGEEPYTFNTMIRRITLSVEDECSPLSGPLLYDPDRNILVLIDNEICNSVTLLDPDDGEVRYEFSVQGRVLQASYHSGVGLFLLFEGSGDIGFYSMDDYRLEFLIDIPETAGGFEYDEGAGLLYVFLKGEPYLFIFDLGSNQPVLTEMVTLPYPVSLMALDRVSEVLYLYYEDESGLDSNFIFSYHESTFSEERFPVDNLQSLYIHSPLHNIYLLEENEEATLCTILNNEESLLEREKPLNIFLLTFIEEPDEDEMYIHCKRSEIPDKKGYRDILDLIEEQARFLYTLDFPVAIGLSNFHISKNELCRTEWVYDLFDSYGFEMGLLLHTSPCYNCTDFIIFSDHPHYFGDICDETSPFYCNPLTDKECCFPCNKHFCLLGEYDCYFRYMSRLVSVVDKGSDYFKFLTGVHNHSSYSWDWVRFARNVERVDSTYGFPVLLFASASAYPSLIKDDPRGKEFAPFSPKARYRTWSPSTYTEWDEDNGDDSLIYIGGETVAVNALSEWFEKGIYYNDFLLMNFSTAYDEKDFEILELLIKKALSYSSERNDGSFYFHIPDIATFDLSLKRRSEEKTGRELLYEFIEFLKGKYINNGLAIPSLPSEIRERVVER